VTCEKQLKQLLPANGLPFKSILVVDVDLPAVFMGAYCSTPVSRSVKRLLSFLAEYFCCLLAFWAVHFIIISAIWHRDSTRNGSDFRARGCAQEK